MWAARLAWSGTQAELKYVISQSGLDSRIEEVDGNLHLRLDALSEDDAEPRSEANDTIRVANGICGVLQAVGRFSIKNIQRVEERGAPTQYLYVEGFTATQFGYPEVVGGQAHNVNYLIAADSNTAIAEALGFLGEIRGDDWVNLNKVIELLHRDRAPLAEWGMANRIDRIKRVANSPEAAGRSSRHAVARGDQPKPMPFEEALGAIRQAVRCWAELRSAP